MIAAENLHVLNDQFTIDKKGNMEITFDDNEILTFKTDIILSIITLLISVC